MSLTAEQAARLFALPADTCRRVRDERNDWHTIEKYLEHLGEVKLSHGICPTCYATAAAEFGESRARPSFKVTTPPIAD